MRNAWIMVIICVALAALGGGVYAMTRAKPTSIPKVSSIQPGGETIPSAPTVEQSAVPPALTDTPSPIANDQQGQTPTMAYTLTLTPTETFTSVPQLGPGSAKTNPTDGMLLLYVPKGNFSMGDSADHAQSECERVSNLCVPNVNIAFTDEAPRHTVYLDAFWIDKTEVTNAMYSLCVKAGKCTPNSGGNDSDPVVNVTWSDASAYCAWARGRLPTEAEWEKAARGTDERTFPWGSSAPSCSLANYSGCAGHALAVGSLPDGASFYGALDMAGNVWEWVADWFKAGYGSAPNRSDPNCSTPTSCRSMRGGSYSNSAGFMRTTGRGYYNPNNKLKSIGFRCAANP